MKISSSAFKDGQQIPEKYTCNGDNISPPLLFIDVPQETQSMVLIMEDPDASGGTFTHWLVYNIPPTVPESGEGRPPVGSMVGQNSTGNNEYTGPCPPNGTHHYHFKLYALDESLDLEENAAKSQVEDAMKEHVTLMSEIIGLYSSPQ